MPREVPVVPAPSSSVVTGEIPAGPFVVGAPLSRRARIFRTLRLSLNPQELRVQDCSAEHAGHRHGPAPSSDGTIGESHFRVRLRASVMKSLPTLVARHRAVYDALKEEFQPRDPQRHPANWAPMHALELDVGPTDDDTVSNFAPLRSRLAGPSQRKLIVVADDLGMFSDRDEGLFHSFSAGLVSQCALVVNGGSSESAFVEAKRIGMPLGLHLNLTEGAPLSDPRHVPSLLRTPSHGLPQMLGKVCCTCSQRFANLLILLLPMLST